ncbi:unnamed protein product [uncultured bacterium]|nr:unnamed protein product [uncultured bacterium]
MSEPEILSPERAADLEIEEAVDAAYDLFSRVDRPRDDPAWPSVRARLEAARAALAGRVGFRAAKLGARVDHYLGP